MIVIPIHTRLGLFLALSAATALAQRGPAIQQQLSFTPYHPNGVYKVGETVGWTVKPGPVEPTYAYKWTIRRNNAVVLKEGKMDLSPGNTRIEVLADQPEMFTSPWRPTRIFRGTLPRVQPHQPLLLEPLLLPNLRVATPGAIRVSTRLAPL